MSPASHDANLSVSGLVSCPTTALATVISSPSRIQATPRAITMRVWKGDHGNRSIRAGMRLRITPGAGASRVGAIERLRARAYSVVAGGVHSPCGTGSIARTFTRSGVIAIMGRRERIESTERGHAAHMQLPEPRGPLSPALSADRADGTSLSPAPLAQAERTAAASAEPLLDEDLQLSLGVCYELHYRGFDGVAESWEWDPELLRLRALLEHRHTGALHALVGPLQTTGEPIDRQLTALLAADDSPSLSSYMAKQGTLE